MKCTLKHGLATQEAMRLTGGSNEVFSAVVRDRGRFARRWLTRGSL